MSIFTFRVTKTLDQIPGAPGETVTIRKLAPRHLDAAAKASQMEAIAHTMNTATDTVADEVEPFLLRSELVVRTPRGRMATVNAYRHLQIALPTSSDPSSSGMPTGGQPRLFD